jgi:hypothetical protein
LRTKRKERGERAIGFRASLAARRCRRQGPGLTPLLATLVPPVLAPVFVAAAFLAGTVLRSLTRRPVCTLFIPIPVVAT